jgi:ATP-dependent Lhr-like helicase
MINNEYLELTEEKTLIIGLAGERLLNNYKFYAVFQDSEDFTVRCGSEEIGTITTPPPAGDRFALAGRVWEVEDLDIARRLVFVHRVNGKMEVSWPGDGGEIHTKLLLAMRRVLLSDKPYPYLSENAAVRLADARHLAKRAGLEKKNLVSLGGQSYVLFPWLGTVSFRTLRRLLKTYATELGISDIESQGCCYITFKAKQGAAEYIEAAICDILQNLGGDTENLVSASECPVFDKYDEFIPPELLRRAYATDRLQLHELRARYLGEERNEE